MANTSSNQPVSFTQDTLLVAELIALLEREQAHLVKADVDAIEAILEEKSLLLQRLNLAAKARYQLLQANGFSSNESGMSDWVEKQAKKRYHSSLGCFPKVSRTSKRAKQIKRYFN